jgi:hypothetical protein
LALLVAIFQLETTPPCRPIKEPSHWGFSSIATNVGFGSKADIQIGEQNVRFVPIVDITFSSGSGETTALG